MTKAGMLARIPEERRAPLLMTDAQVRASWVREQEWNRAHGLPYYSVLRDVDHRIAERIPDA